MVCKSFSDGQKFRIELVGVQRNLVSQDSDKSGFAFVTFLAKVTEADFSAERSILHFGLTRDLRRASHEWPLPDKNLLPQPMHQKRRF